MRIVNELGIAGARPARPPTGSGGDAGPRSSLLLDLKTCRTVLLDDSHRTVAQCAVGFHRRRIEDRAVGAASERKAGQDLPIGRAQDYDYWLRRVAWRVSQSGPRGERLIGFGFSALHWQNTSKQGDR